MANSLAALKNLPCPAGNNCTAFQCLFKHENENKPTIASQSEEQTLTKNPNLSTDQDSPRKRIKLSPVTPSTTPQNTSTHVGPEKTEPAKQESVAPAPLIHQPQPSTEPTKLTDTMLPDIQGSVDAMTSASPPKPSKPPSTLRATTKPSPRPSPKQSPKPPLKQTPKKAEALNPRLLKKSPAAHDARLKLVKLLHEQYARLNTELKNIAKDDEKKLLLSDQELIIKTLDDEQEIATKKAAVYGNSIRNRITTYKRMVVAQWKDERASVIKALEPQETQHTPAEYEPIVTGLTVAQEIDFLHRLVWPLAGMERYGYVTVAPSDDDIKAAQEAVESSKNTEVCDRCTRRFQVFPGRREEDGALASNGSCTHHPGKIYYPQRSAGDVVSPSKKYRCCHQSVDDESSAGCTTAPTHVFKTTDPKRLAAVLNFAQTPPNPDVPTDRAVCFDCEMGYTVYGLELIRITAVAWPNGEELLDILVQPVGEYMDLNTRYSGVRPEDMATAEIWKKGDDHRPTLIPSSDPTKPPQRKLKIAPSPKVARDLLFSLIKPETPLIGHGLENDLNAARIIHPTCIDTVLLYPHRRGLPIRNGLKMLMETKLGRKIQVETDEDNPAGHDSAEDAKAAGELVRLKVRDEWKTLRSKGWTIVNDKIIPPAGGV
ncbi:hypothetical protein F5X99DRAFT_146822 [Biscogniauxia marginata]|nr:hypothetical protein F5X99DRAFT_146822 [Biscogniauxia marginata]